MTIIVTDAKDPIHLTEDELRKYKELYERTYQCYFGKPPTLEEFIRMKRIPPNVEPVKLTDSMKSYFNDQEVKKWP